ncbi:MAG: ATP-binding cassette domain-containing protein [Candidatus Paceibacterota bacterium]
MQQSKLEITDLNVSYETHTVLQNLSHCFYPGQIHGILGTNGAGKTTLFKSIYGLLKPDSGSIILQGFEEDSNCIAYLETEPTFYAFMKGDEYLELLSHNNKSFDPDTWSSLFNLPLNDFIETYSTGMKKKLALLGILSLDRPIMLLDEPHTGLDLESVKILDKILHQLKSRGKLILFTSHILEVLTKNCDKISLLQNQAIQSTFNKGNYADLENFIESQIKLNSGEILKTLFQSNK